MEKELIQEIISRKYRILLDQDFVDVYYIILREYADYSEHIRKMTDTFKRNASDYVKNFDQNFLFWCYYIDRIEKNIIFNDYYVKFCAEALLHDYKKIRNNNTIKGIKNKNDNKLYLIEFTFIDLIYISCISNGISGHEETSLNFFKIGSLPLIPSVIFESNKKFCIKIAIKMELTRDILNYLKN